MTDGVLIIERNFTTKDSPVFTDFINILMTIKLLY